MRLTYLAHACLLVESGGVKLVTDPWLDGPTYLSAWWQFPAPARTGADLRGVDYVYLTHEHVDHFHEPTLRALPPSTPILIGRFLSPRFRDKLRALGFTDVRELPHGREVALGTSLRVTSYQYRADDTALVLRDDEATVLDLNDCLTRSRSLEQILKRHPRIDLLAASFANAEAYPIVYQFEDPAERIDWDDRSRFDAFLEKVRQIQPRAFVPFASMFCFLSDQQRALNDKIVSPEALIRRARAGEVDAAALPMNPGDVWTPKGGLEIVRPIDWADKPAILDAYAAAHRDQLRALALAEVVPGGARSLAAAFDDYFDGLQRRALGPLKRKLDLSIRFDVTGPAGGTFWLRFHRGHLDRGAPASPSGDAWDVRISIGDWPLHRVLSGKDTWQTLGISCRFQVTLRPGARAKELWFWLLVYLDDMGYAAWRPFFTPRALGVLLRRHRELEEHAWQMLRGSFAQGSLRGKFSAG